MAKNHGVRFVELVDSIRPLIQECTIDDVVKRQAANDSFVLVDVREESEFNAGQIPGAKHLGKGVIERDIEEAIPDSSTSLVLYCGGGYRSALAAYNLQQMGYTSVISMDGGFRAWKESGREIDFTPKNLLPSQLSPANPAMPQTAPSHAIHFQHEDRSNAVRDLIDASEPHSLRTFTPSQAVLAKSAGVFHWTPEGRRLFDYSSGVLVANLGHNPKRWMYRFTKYLGWNPSHFSSSDDGFFQAVSLTAYNAITELEAEASRRLVANLQASAGGRRLDTVIWAASGSEAVQKALWACMRRDPDRQGILATRFGFHGKKGLSGAVTGSESDSERDPRVHFISFPREECSDIDHPVKPFDPVPYRQELDRVWAHSQGTIGCLITEPYLGGGGSFHPPKAYLPMLQQFCREHDILFILDEVQANFGRTGKMYAFEAYGIEPDFVCLGKGLGNGIPVSAAVGRRDVCEPMGYGSTSDTWSANPLSSAAVLATLDEFESTDILERTRNLSNIFADGLRGLKETGLIVNVRGEGMVFGIECGAHGDKTPNQVANAIVERCYQGNSDNDGIHLLGPLANCVIRVSPPMCMTDEDAKHSLQLLFEFVSDVARL